MKPRIYTYKITFPHQGWWYWGVHKEKTFDDSYNGSPVTHAEKWKNFEFEKQILEFFEDYNEARKVEKRLIDPDLNNPLCLNENSGGGFSLKTSSEGGKIAGKIAVESGHLESVTSFESRSKGGKIAVESGQLASIRTPESCAKGGRKSVELGHLQSISSKGGRASYEMGVGLHGLSEKETFEKNSKGGKRGSRNTNSQRWRCLVTGYISNPGTLSCYQKARGIDTSLRERVKTEGVV